MLRCECLFEAWQYIAEWIDNQGLAALDDINQILVAHGADDDRQLPTFLNAAIDVITDGIGFFGAVDKGYRVGLEGVIGKLGQQTHPQGFSRDGGTIGEKKHLTGI